MLNRSDSIDVLKGLLMLAVMLGHNRLLMLTNGVSLYNILYTFHIPGFFFVAALLNRSGLSAAKTGTKTISYLYPQIVFFSALSAVYLLAKANPAGTLPGWLFAMFSGNGYVTKPYSGLQSLWYLPAIYCFYLVSGIYNGQRNFYVKAAMLVLPFIAVVYAFALDYPFQRIPFGLPAVAFILPVAIFVREMVDRYGDSSWLYAVSLIAVVVLLPQIQDSELNMASTHLYPDGRPELLIAALLFMTSMFFVLMKASTLLVHNKLLGFIGRHSLEIYLVHHIFDIILFNGVGARLGVPTAGMTAALFGLLFFFITLSLSLGVAWLADKTVVRYLFQPPSLSARKRALAPR